MTKELKGSIPSSSMHYVTEVEKSLLKNRIAYTLVDKIRMG